MITYIYDIEVFSDDWIVVFRRPEENSNHIVIHNDNYHLREFLSQEDIILGGFNVKHYDDYILKAIIHGADNAIVKELNDFIIGGSDPWTFPFLQYKKKTFKSFDLRDDLPNGLSLKAIEGNNLANIVETGVDFNINRKLTLSELKSTIKYCKNDVDATIDLYHKRSKYLESKLQVAKLKGIPEDEALGLTNAKLTARFLDAKKQSFDDEFVYDIPEELKIGKYSHVLEFFLDPIGYTLRDLEERLKNETRKVKIKSLTNKIEKIKKANRYKCKLETMIAGVPHVYGWGGLHGAIKNYFMLEDDDYLMWIADVGSYYPSMALQYGYTSRAIPSAAGYKEVYDTRMKAKKEGDKATANALKLILNTFYGAMKNKYNDLYDPRNASAICITGMLLLTDLIDKLENVPGMELIQSNTDGIIIRFPRKYADDTRSIINEWEKRTRLTMEITEVKAIAQKDVNNYVMKDADGHLKSKGGYVSLSAGGDFKNNSLVVLHKALVKYFMDGIPIKETINNNNNIADYQIIAKTGSTYDGTVWEVDNEYKEIQKVNRVYASKDTRYGTIYKVKNGKRSSLEVTLESDEEDSRTDKIASLPDHCIIDNDNKLTIEDIDKGFYIDLARKRVDDYLGNKKQKIKKEVITTMAAATKTNDVKTMNVYQKLIEARVRFLASDVKKSGINRFAEYKYFELADIVPVATKIFNELGLLFVISFDSDKAIGTLYNVDSFKAESDSNLAGIERIIVTSPMRDLEVKGMNAIQALGGVETYQRRYLYMAILDIVEADSFDATQGKPDENGKSETPKNNRPVTPEKREEIKKELINEGDEATDVQVKSIKNGLKKLRAKDEKYEDYIKAIVKKLKDGITKTEGESILIEIGEKVAE